MSDPNFLQQAIGSALNNIDASQVEGFVEQGVEAIASRVPGGQLLDEAMKDQVVQNVADVVSEHLEGGTTNLMNNVQGMFGQG